MEELRSDRSSAGDEFTAVVVEDLLAEGQVVLREGAEIRGRVLAAQDSRSEPPTLTLSIEPARGATPLEVPVEPILIKGKRQSKLKRILKGAGAAVVGAIVGKKAAGTKGAIAGAGVGVVALLMTGDHLVLPEGTKIQFQISRTVSATGGLPGRQRGRPQ